MCGIVGVLDCENKFGVSKELLVSMADTLVHRGPDDEGYFIDGGGGLGFRRLAIIDLLGGAQPMFNEDRSLVLVCNGEIFNYKELKKELQQCGHEFASECDVEVLLHLYEEYGVDFLNRLNGQFAFCIYDIKKRTFFLARDHVGIAPLFYAVIGNVFVFGSEIKAILRHPAIKRKVNLTGLDQIITFPGNVSPTTMFENVYSVKPGHYIYTDGYNTHMAEYWDLDYPADDTSSNSYKEEYYVEKLAELLHQAVAYRLNSDVPVGFYLSGGLDSSFIAAIIQKMTASEKRHSFSIGFPHHHAIDEKMYREVMLQQLRSVHHEILFDPADIESRLKRAVYHAESPLKESYNTCSLALSEEVKRNDIKVILTGEGADELFAGYVGYRFDRQRQHAMTGFYDHEEALERERRRELWGVEDFLYDKNYGEVLEVKQALYSNKLNEAFNSFNSVREGLVNKNRIKHRHILHLRSYLDFKLRLSDHLVADHGDRVSYAHSIEARYPFLDINIIKFVKIIPPDLKLFNFIEKYILKKCAGPYVPAEIIDREKFSFVAPGSQYLIRKNIPWIEELLSYNTIKSQGYFNPDTVERLKKMYRSDNFNLNQTFETDLLMIVLTFGIFLERFGIGPV